jgi:hypothetical protein
VRRLNERAEETKRAGISTIRMQTIRLKPMPIQPERGQQEEEKRYHKVSRSIDIGSRPATQTLKDTFDDQDMEEVKQGIEQIFKGLTCIERDCEG